MGFQWLPKLIEIIEAFWGFQLKILPDARLLPCPNCEAFTAINGPRGTLVEERDTRASNMSFSSRLQAFKIKRHQSGVKNEIQFTTFGTDLESCLWSGVTLVAGKMEKS